MARIKYVVNERRLAYEDAMKILDEHREIRKLRVEYAREIAERKAAELLKGQADSVPDDSSQHQPKPADIAAAGLFETVGVQRSTSAQTEPEKKSQ